MYNGERVDINTDSGHPAIQLRDNDADGRTPYIDFSNDPDSDYDGRIILVEDDLLRIDGADLAVQKNIILSGDIIATPGNIICIGAC